MKIELENSYKKDYKRALKQGLIGKNELAELDKIIKALVAKQPLAPKHKDHALNFDYKGCRDCHIKPDLVLIYRTSPDMLYLVRIGRHQDLFKGY